MNFDELIQLQVLKLKASVTGAQPMNGKFTDQLIEQGALPELRQMCAKVHPSLYAALEQVCDLLDMSKRQFIEAAVSDAVLRAHQTLDKYKALDDAQGSL